MEDDTETPPCTKCGKPSVTVIDGVPWCEGCLHEMGSCCGEWHEKEETEDQP